LVEFVMPDDFLDFISSATTTSESLTGDTTGTTLATTLETTQAAP
jgi:hypothetical protein